MHGGVCRMSDICDGFQCNDLPESTTQFVVVHIRLGLPLSPSTGDFIWICEFELSIRSLPCDAICIARITQELQEKLPQLDLSTTCHPKVPKYTFYIVTKLKSTQTLVPLYSSHSVPL